MSCQVGTRAVEGLAQMLATQNVVAFNLPLLSLKI